MKNWTSTIDDISTQSLAEFGALNKEQLNWKPNADTWSIAQNLEHLIVINETYYPVLAAIKAGTYRSPFMARFGFIVSFLGKNVFNAVQPDRKKKMKTFPIWEPSASNLTDDILDRFQLHQKELKRQIEGAHEFINKGIVISSPANKHIVYKLETAFDIIVTHEQRHLEQAKETLQRLKQHQSLRAELL
jgi:hypothetical protein